VVAGLVEVPTLTVLGEFGPFRTFTHPVSSMLGGSEVGGSCLVAMLAHGQVADGA